MDAIKLAAYAEQHLPRSKAAMCCILPRDIVWMHLYASRLLTVVTCVNTQANIHIAFKLDGYVEWYYVVDDTTQCGSVAQLFLHLVTLLQTALDTWPSFRWYYITVLCYTSLPTLTPDIHKVCCTDVSSSALHSLPLIVLYASQYDRPQARPCPICLQWYNCPVTIWANGDLFFKQFLFSTSS